MKTNEEYRSGKIFCLEEWKQGPRQGSWFHTKRCDESEVIEKANYEKMMKIEQRLILPCVYVADLVQKKKHYA